MYENGLVWRELPTLSSVKGIAKLMEVKFYHELKKSDPESSALSTFDVWSNSSDVKGIRSLRFRVFFWDYPQVAEMLTGWYMLMGRLPKGSVLVQSGGDIILRQKDNGVCYLAPRYWISFKMFYRSRQERNEWLVP